MTYARPSVYFEAGFAQRAVPVIYTVRRDHLSGRKDDGYGNFKVHFDLQMKNIIPWEHPTDAKFVSRFANRVSVVSQPIIARRKWDRHLSEQRSRFAGLPIVERFESITSACRDLLEENGLHEVGYGVPGYRGGTYSRLSSSSVVKWVGVRNSKSLAESVLIVVDARIGSRLLKDVRNLQGFPEYDLYSIVRRDLLCNWVEERCEQLKWMGPSAT